jgi:hypothetical protein
MTRLVILLIIAALCVGAVLGAAGKKDCGTCESLGYTCVASGTKLADACGKRLDAAHCPIPSCREYCKKLFQHDNGRCDDTTHECDCSGAASGPATPTKSDTTTTTATATPPAKSTTTRPRPPPPTPNPPPAAPDTPLSECLGNCSTVLQSWKCVMVGQKDACTGDTLSLSLCGLLDCNTQCGTPGGSSKCVIGQTCRCNATKPDGGGGALSPPVRTKSTSGGPATHSATAGGSAGVHAATVDVPTVTELVAGGTATFSTATLTSFIIIVCVIGLFAIAGIVVWVMKSPAGALRGGSADYSKVAPAAAAAMTRRVGV